MSHVTILHTCRFTLLYDDDNVTYIIGFRLKVAKIKENRISFW